MAPVEGRNVRTNTMFSEILAVLFAIKILASHPQIYRLPNIVFEQAKKLLKSRKLIVILLHNNQA